MESDSTQANTARSQTLRRLTLRGVRTINFENPKLADNARNRIFRTKNSNISAKTNFYEKPFLTCQSGAQMSWINIKKSIRGPDELD